MKILKISVIFLSFIILSSASYSQISISLGPIVGYTSPSGDYSGTPLEYYNGTSYGLSGGVHFGAMFRLKIPFISGRAAITYASLSNDGSTGSGGQTTEVKHKLLTIAIGPEFYFSIPMVPVRPYAGIDLLFTSFSGESTFQGMPKVNSGQVYSLSSTSRTGLGFGVGVNVGLGKKYSLDAGIRYNLHNLFGKEFKGGTDRGSSYTSLNDEKDPNYAPGNEEHFIANDRTISTIQFNVGFLFDF